MQFRQATNVNFTHNIASMGANRGPLMPIHHAACFNENRIKAHFEKNMKKPAQSAVVDTQGVDEMLTQDENTLAHLQAMISEESKDRNLLSPPDSVLHGAVYQPHQQHLYQITDISSSSMKVSHKYEYPKYLTNSFSMDNDGEDKQ